MKAAVLLHNNSQSTSVTLTAVERLNRGLGVDITLIPAWASLLSVNRGDEGRVGVGAVSPTSVNMRRVAAAMTAIDRAEDGPLDRDVLNRQLDSAAAQPVSSLLMFAAACATGASGLAVVFGVTDPRAVLLAAASAAFGGFIRRLLGRFGIGIVAQALVAATVAGFVGDLAIRLNLGPAAQLVALCPAMVLVPGPHLLNGGLDLLGLRLTLGIARLGFAALVLTAIGLGLIAGLGMGGQTLAVSAIPAQVPLYADVIGAGIAAASYPVYFSMPYRMIGWPVTVGMLAHAVHWWALIVWNLGPAIAAFLSCLLAGVVLLPVAHVLRIPFAAVGFASVVALLPGAYVFRMLSGLIELTRSPSPALLAAAASDGTVAALVVLGMAIGLIVPMHIFAACRTAQER